MVIFASALPARGASVPGDRRAQIHRLCLGAACTGCIVLPCGLYLRQFLCLGAACTGCIGQRRPRPPKRRALPRRCLHGVHHRPMQQAVSPPYFASALPARGASIRYRKSNQPTKLCLGAACTGCIGKSRQIAAHLFVAYAVSR